jgi:hypothetical protein
VWACGRVGVWAYGRMGVWAYGRMGVRRSARFPIVFVLVLVIVIGLDRHGAKSGGG